MVRSSWPSPQDFDEALQTPELSFADQELRFGIVETNALGLPRPICGSFASVYKVAAGNRTYAVRCFLHSVQGQHERYVQIARFIRQKKLAWTASFDYQHEGIKVNGRWFPILKMEWVAGETLERYVSRHVHDKEVIERLIERFLNMCREADLAGIAHGDLQHGNILVLPDGHILLVDYDGMYVPEMAGLCSNELGHRNYQHPERRAEHFGPELDNFSAWGVYVSLKAISIDPSVYRRLRGGDDCLLFRRQDFDDPVNSMAFEELRKLPRPLPDLVETMQILLKNPPLYRIPLPSPHSALVKATSRAQDIIHLAAQSMRGYRSAVPRNYPNRKVSVKGLVTRKYSIGDCFEIECQYEIISHNGVELATPVMQICRELWEKIERGEELELLYDPDQPYIFWWNDFTDKRFAGVVETPLRSIDRRLRVSGPIESSVSLLLTIWGTLAALLCLASDKVLAIMFGIVVFAVMAFRVHRSVALIKYGIAVRGRVCKVGAAPALRVDCFIQYEYPVLDADNVIDVLTGTTAVSREQWLALEDGEAVTVLYDPNMPSRSMIYRLSAFRALVQKP